MTPWANAPRTSECSTLSRTAVARSPRGRVPGNYILAKTESFNSSWHLGCARYQRLIREAASGKAADAAAAAFARGDQEGSLATIRNEMVAALTASGTAADCRVWPLENRSADPDAKSPTQKQGRLR